MLWKIYFLNDYNRKEKINRQRYKVKVGEVIIILKGIVAFITDTLLMFIDCAAITATLVSFTILEWNYRFYFI